MLSTISNALDTYLQAELSGNALDVAWEGVEYNPETDRPYLRVTLSAYTRAPQGPGANTIFLERGTYSVVVVWPVGAGKAPALAEADKIRAMFPRGLSLTLSGQAPLIVQGTSLAPASDTGDWLNVPVMVGWLTSEFGP
jgi:hypothetical protein